MQINYMQDKLFSYQNIKNLPLQQLNAEDDLSQCIQMILQRPKVVKSKKKKSPLQLKQLIKKAKVNLLKQNFIRKLKRTIVYDQVPQQILQKQYQNNNQNFTIKQKIKNFLQNTQGINLNAYYQTIWSFINILQITIVTIIFSLILAFPQTQSLSYIIGFRMFSMFMFLIDMILNFVTKRQQMGKIKGSLMEIAQHYLQNQFLSDVIFLILFPISLAFSEQENINILNLIIGIIKLNHYISRFQKFQYLYITKSQRQLYYGLLKVFLLNFAIAHVLSIVLNLMGNIQQQSWYDKHNIRDRNWSEKYVWGYYWGTTIMLTVGFGDISASNQRQAIILIFIQTLSCITLAYNINCVGSIISQMRADNQEKKKKLKYFHKMCQQNNVTKQLETKICNFIQESYQIKQAFQFDQYQQVLQTLPKNLHSQYIKQSNKHLFEVSFFNTLNKKTLLSLAQNVVRRITHPQEVIKRKGQIADFMILQRGKIGLVCKKNKSLINGSVIESFNIEKNGKPKILSLDFIKRKVLNYDVKSLSYTVIYYLDYQRFMQSLKQSCQMDFDLFCVMRDKDDYILGENQLYKCTLCKNQYHNRFECPKYHYKPLKQHSIAANFQKMKFAKQLRNNISFQRSYRNKRVLIMNKGINKAHKKFIQQNCSEYQRKQIQNIKKYFFQRQLTKLFCPQYQSSTQNTEFEKQMNKIEQLLVKHKNNEDFWNIECDLAYNTKYYYTGFNPSNLIGTRVGQFKKYGQKQLFANFFNGLSGAY